MKGSSAICVLLSLLVGGQAMGQNPVERGRELFLSEKLGSNGKSCETCHPDGSGLERAASYSDGKLADIVNNCIKKALAGKPLESRSPEMKAMIMYIRSLALPSSEEPGVK